MQITPKDRNIENMFNQLNEQFIVPSYQRRYAWGDSQTRAMFEDIDMLDINDGHLFGLIIIYTDQHHGGTNRMDVVDGQQRLTSISILLHAVGEQFKRLGDNEESIKFSKLLHCGISDKERESKVILGELDNQDYQFILSGKPQKAKNKKLADAYYLFSRLLFNRIEEKGLDWLQKFSYKLLQKAVIIRLDVQQAQDAYKLFETINNRGLRLSATDIIKNFILGHAAKLGSDVLQNVKELWTDMIVALDGLNKDDFFRQYTSSVITRKIPKTKLIAEFKSDYYKNVDGVELLGEYQYNYADDGEEPSLEEDEDINLAIQVQQTSVPQSGKERVSISCYVTQIVDAAKCYGKIARLEFKDSSLNSKLNEIHLIKSFPSYIYLMHYLQCDRPINEKIEVVSMVGALMLRRHICARRTSESDDIFAHLLRLSIEGDNYLVVCQD